MAKDDYSRLVCIILAYLYARLKGKTEVQPEVFLQPMTKDLPISEEYFMMIIEDLLKNGFISGVKPVKVWGGETIKIAGINRIRITGDGIQYLCENTTMKKTLEWIRDNMSPLPGMVSTIIGILQMQ